MGNIDSIDQSNQAINDAFTSMGNDINNSIIQPSLTGWNNEIAPVLTDGFNQSIIQPINDAVLPVLDKTFTNLGNDIVSFGNSTLPGLTDLGQTLKDGFILVGNGLEKYFITPIPQQQTLDITPWLVIGLIGVFVILL
jgi:hypothetical protein